jgi:hypothetical protein
MPLQATSGAASYDAFGGGVPVVPTYIEDVFSTYLYTGNGSTQTITNGIDLAGKGGLVWLKSRSGAENHILTDSARGVAYFLRSNLTNAQDTNSPSLISAFNNNGFGLGVGYAGINGSGESLVSWTFRKQPKFFDVVTYTGNGTQGRSVSHNLGSAPGFMIVKRTDGVDNWRTYHRSLGGTKFMSLDTTAAAGTANTLWNNADPTSTVFYLGNDSSVNGNGMSYVAYLFAHDAGGFGLTGTDNVISCGSYTGNGVVAGPSVTLGYEPQWVLVKSSTVAGAHWYLMDTMRGMAHTVCNELYANLSADEIAQTKTIIPTAIGFNVATNDSYINNNGSTYIYIAIRRGPMKVPTSGTSVFSPIARSGTGATSTVSNSIKTDLIISMTRNTGQSSGVWDRLRGFAAYLETTGTASESTSSDSVTAMNNTSYVLGADGGTDRINRSGYTYANWTFSRAPSFFDEVCYTGTGATRALTHNLGVAPELSIIKSRSLAVENWNVWHKDLGSPSAGYYYYLALNGNNARASSNDRVSTVTSTVVNMGNNDEVNASGSTYVAYLFATCAGVSKVGSYTGTGTTKQIDCGFTGGARFVLIKRVDSTGGWYVWDSARGIVSGNDPYLLLNTTDAEVTSTDYIDTYSAGFEISSTAPAAINASGDSFIFLAIA